MRALSALYAVNFDGLPLFNDAILYDVRKSHKYRHPGSFLSQFSSAASTVALAAHTGPGPSYNVCTIDCFCYTIKSKAYHGISAGR